MSARTTKPIEKGVISQEREEKRKTALNLRKKESDKPNRERGGKDDRRERSAVGFKTKNIQTKTSLTLQ